MNPILQNVLAVIAGLISGSLVNMGIISIGGTLIPPPEGVDLSSAESLKEAMHLLEAKHYLMPFLAHALGTFVGAMIAALIAVSRLTVFAMAITGFFFLGGLIMIITLPSPLWFTILDLALAYFPMGILGVTVARFIRGRNL